LATIFGARRRALINLEEKEIMAPKTRKEGQQEGHTDGDSANNNGGNEEVNSMGQEQRIPENSQTNGLEVGLVQQFTRTLSDPESGIAKALMAMIKTAVAQTQPENVAQVNANVNSGQSSGHANGDPDMPPPQVYNNPAFENVLSGVNRIPLGNRNNDNNKSFYQRIPNTIPMHAGIGNNGN
jgi:hypothetical protein